MNSDTKHFIFRKKHSEKCKCDICVLERFKRNLKPRNPKPVSENDGKTPDIPLKYRLKLASSIKY
jgi:hypothetical protein